MPIDLSDAELRREYERLRGELASPMDWRIAQTPAVHADTRRLFELEAELKKRGYPHAH